MNDNSQKSKRDIENKMFSWIKEKLEKTRNEIKEVKKRRVRRVKVKSRIERLIFGRV